MPPLADGFSARPETGPGTPAAILPPGQALVLADPVPPRGRPGSVPGGTGKTQLAVYLAESLWQARQIALLIWVIAATRASVQFGFAQAFTELTGAQPAGDAEEAAHRFLAWLARAGRPWLVVLDDLADPAALAGLWPDGLDGRVVVTARHPGTAADRPGATVFPVGGFSSRESLSYLMGRLSADPDQRLGAVDLADELQGEPLALAQASATIASSDLTCRDYRDLFRQRREQIAEPGTAGPGARAVTWTLSAEHASQLAPGRQAQPCLALAALLDPHGIPGAVFTTAAAGEYIAPGTAVPGGPGPAQAVLVSLERSGLLTIDPASEARTIRVHPATSAAVLAAVPDSMREQAAAAAARSLLEAWPADAGDPWLADAFRSCAGRLAAAAGGVLWTGGYQALLFRHGRSLDQARLTRAAIDHWRELAAASEQALGPGHPDPVTASDRLAGAMLAGGLGPEAVELYQRAVAARTRAAGPDHPATLAARADLGSALLTAGRYGDAIDVLADVLQARARILGPDDPGTLKTTDDLVAAYLAAGRYPEAIRLGRRALTDREQRQGPWHPGTIAARETLASACLAAGRPKDAVTHYRRALADRERSTGPDDPATIATVGALAGAHHAARRLKEALPLYERALRDLERVEGPDHPDTLGARGNLASAYHSAGRMATALELYERSRADCQRVLGPYHPDTLAAQANLAHAWYALGRGDEALALLQATLADCERVLPSGDPLTSAVRESLAAVERG